MSAHDAPRAPGAPEVLVAGAGPTGLNLALWLTRLGVRVRLIDKALEAGTTSRALAVQGRTLELYRQLGIADAVVARARPARGLNLWVAGRRVAHASFADMGRGISPYPEPLIYPQDEHERMLIASVEALGVAVERGAELLSLTQDAGGVSASIRLRDGRVEPCACAYLAGCDGARSAVREALGIGFPGGTYEHQFYVADIEGAGAVLDGELHVGLDESDFLAVFPLTDPGRARLVGTVRAGAEAGAAGAAPPLRWEDVGKYVLGWMDIAVNRVNWFSTYQVHHRVAARFCDRRAFLLGDAAHIHSPVGGQGMNTGIGDAANLGWKLAMVLRARAPSGLLASYEPERIAFARRLVATTDRLFAGVTGSGWAARTFRLRGVPALIPRVLAFASLRRQLFRTVSQVRIHYRRSPLSAGLAGPLRGGDRLPWVELAGGRDTFAPLGSLDWQAHVYGEPRAPLRQRCAERGMALHAFPWREEMRRAGLRQGALYVVRPDGYLGLVDEHAEPTVLDAYLDARGLRMA